MRSITYTSPGELDYSGIDTAERGLIKELRDTLGSSPVDLLPTEKVELPRDLTKLGFTGEMAAEGVIRLADLEETYLHALEEGKSYVGQIMGTALFEELEKEDPELLITITEEVEVHKRLKSGAEAAKYYMEWLDARNTAIEKRFERGTTPEGKAKIIRTWAAMRTLAKKEYIEKINELMTDEEEKWTALTAIQFVSTMQLLTETDILDEFTNSGTTSKQVMSKPAKAAATGILVGTLMRAGDFDGKLVEYSRTHMPRTEEYGRKGGAIASGIKAELYCMQVVAQQLAQVELPNVEELTINKTSRNEDNAGADVVIIGVVNGVITAVFVDVKTGAQPAIGSLEDRNRNGMVALYDGGGAATLPLDAWQVPSGMIGLVKGASLAHRDAFKGTRRRYHRVRVLSMRVKPGSTLETEDPLFLAKTRNCLRWAFA